MSKNFLSAAMVVVALALWLGSGSLTGEELSGEMRSAAESELTAAPGTRQAPPERVRVSLINAERRARNLTLRGRTESKRSVDVKAEVSGQIVSRPVERGMQVEQGDLLCEIAVDDREVTLHEALAALQTAEIEHEGSLKLAAQGLLSDVAIANSEARREAARAHLHRQELNLARTRVVAPFAGVVEQLHMNTGDYAAPGAACATLIDLDPMLVVAHVTESQVDALSIRQAVAGASVTGREVQGAVSFVGRQSDPKTRTYPVEITVDNEDYRLRSGLTVTLTVAVESVSAHRVAPSLLTLNDAGEIGLRILDEANRVVFRPIDVLEDGDNGMWVTGLPEATNLITVGHEYVAVGDIVEPVFRAMGRNQIAGR